MKTWIRTELQNGNTQNLAARAAAQFPTATAGQIAGLIFRTKRALGISTVPTAAVSAPVAKVAPHAETSAIEVKLTTLRESPATAASLLCDKPDAVANYYRAHVTTAPWFNPDVESFVVLHVNSRRRTISHRIVSTGTLDTILVHAREVFRAAIVANASAIVLIHNHPSGDPTPSDADIRVTRDLIRAGQLLKIEVLDHVIMGEATPERPKAHCSLRELGHFYQS